MATYKPQTIRTSGIELEPDLAGLIEGLAQNVHDHWARHRIGEGWRYGARWDDIKKERPDLIPYQDLPESDKEYDRRSVVETLKALVALGYEIRRRA